jgi:PKD repeat protein
LPHARTPRRRRRPSSGEYRAIAQALQTSIVAPKAAISSTGPARPGENVDFNAGGSYDPSGDEITSYDWDFNGDGTVDETTSVPLTSHVYADAFSGDAIVTVHSANGIGSASTELLITPDAPHAPGAVAGIEADPAAPGTLAFHWQPPSDDGGSPVTGYAFLVAPGSGGDPVAVAIVDASTTSISLPGLDPGDYLISISAANEIDEGPATTATVSVTAPPSAVDRVTLAFRSDDGKSSFTWSGELTAGSLSVAPQSSAPVERVRGSGTAGNPAFKFTVALTRLPSNESTGAVIASRGQEMLTAANIHRALTRTDERTVSVETPATYRNGSEALMPGTLKATFTDNA